MHIKHEKQLAVILRMLVLAITVMVASAATACSDLAPSVIAPTAVAPSAAASPTAAPAQAPTTAGVALPTPDCSRGITPEQTEGPYYKANTPPKTSLLSPGMAGTPITLTGYVLSRDCKPIAGAVLDFWQANDEGQYDNSGYTLRGHESTDASGRYTLQTIIPGLYPGRTRHIHVKVQAPNQPVLTTQLYFPDVQQNSADNIYDPKLLITWQEKDKVAVFNFVLNISQ